MTLLLAAAHALSTVALCGLIWFVQVVHYPLFETVGRAGGASDFATFARRHQHLTGMVVIPLMLTELATAVLLVIEPPASGTFLARLGLVLLLVVWASTAWLQVPRHRVLARGYDAEAVRRLVATNWIRTIAWTVRAVIAVSLLIKAS